MFLLLRLQGKFASHFVYFHLSAFFVLFYINIVDQKPG